jgi:hypothetical protein
VALAALLLPASVSLGQEQYTPDPDPPATATPAPESLPTTAPEDGQPKAGAASGATAPAAAPKVGDGGKDAKAGGAKADEGWKHENWAKVPPIVPPVRVGWFILPPSGPGYYSLLDQLRGEYRESPPRFPMGAQGLNSNPYFNYDFRYLESPTNTQVTWSDPYKRIHLCDDNVLLSMGGEIRDRYMDETSSRGTGRKNVYHLFRTRAYVDAWYQDEYRFFADLNYTQTFNQDLPQLPSDASGPELQNVFLEAKAGTFQDRPIYVRAGRQELLYGSQRLISPPDWSNIRRTFQGVKSYWQNEKWNVDAFWVQPVAADPDRFDSVDSNRNFFGVWATYRPRKGATMDMYVLSLLQSAAPTNGDTNTFGGRLSGDIDQGFLYDFEAAVQSGTRGGRQIYAQMATGGIGYRFGDCPWTPHIWAYYDYASGDKDPTGRSGSYRTFNQLFAQAHNYFGYIDLVARQNIHDLNFQVSVTPVPWMNALIQYHIFRLDSARDALYAARGVVLRSDPTGRSGNQVGSEIDFLLNMHLSTHTDLMIGLSEFYGGSFWKQTGSPENVATFYSQASIKF